jgi:pterin-4a-carbinolamine dehydratase
MRVLYPSFDIVGKTLPKHNIKHHPLIITSDNKVRIGYHILKDMTRKMAQDIADEIDLDLYRALGLKI